MTALIEATAPSFCLPVSRQAEARRLPVGAALVAVDAVALVGPVIIWSRNWWGAALVALILVALGLRRHYRIGISPSVADRVCDILGCVVVPLGLVLSVAHGSIMDKVNGPVIPLILAAGAGSALLLVARACSYASIRALRVRGLLREPILIIGAGKMGVELARILDAHPEYGLFPVGFLDNVDDTDLYLPLLGAAEDLDAFLRVYPDIRRVIIAFGATREPDMVTILRACDQADVDMYVLPRFFELAYGAKEREVEVVWGLPLRRLRRSAARRRGQRLKRAFDVVASASGIVLLAPAFILLALAVRLSSPGPILFRQSRVGHRDTLIKVLKFRTLQVNDRSDVQWGVSNGDRPTAVGRVLRRTSLDELPQLFNVLRGDMSLVGPRPERPFFVSRFQTEVPRYADRHRMPVGMTGLAQVYGLRGDTSIDHRARIDNLYIENWSLWEDLVILVRTVLAVFRTARTPE
ncbi:MAG: sugar transferase [Actinomycetota bacterium]|nr:sugar transferase [Actinomycetota bacterium]